MRNLSRTSRLLGNNRSSATWARVRPVPDELDVEVTFPSRQHAKGRAVPETLAYQRATALAPLHLARRRRQRS